MLVLSRRLDEKVVLPGLGITIQVVAIKSGSVRIGIVAPAEVTVFREELLAGADHPGSPTGKPRPIPSRSPRKPSGLAPQPATLPGG